MILDNYQSILFKSNYKYEFFWLKTVSIGPKPTAVIMTADNQQKVKLFFSFLSGYLEYTY